MIRHTHRLAAPKRYAVLRKKSHYIISSNPGAHSRKNSVPLLLILRDMMNIAKNASEAKAILNSNKVEIDGTTRKNPKLPVGLMDVVSVQGVESPKRLIFDRHGKVSLLDVKKEESKIKPCKIVTKKKTKGGKIQFGLHDGRTIISDKGDFNTGDTLIIELPKQKIKKHIPLEKDVFVYITDGRHVGEFARVMDFKKMGGSAPDRVLLKDSKEESFETPRNYIFVIGKENSEINLGEQI